MKFSALIPYKPNDFYRIKNLAIIKKRWQEKVPDVELIISTNNDKNFNRAKAINQAVRQATGDYFIIVDNDIVFGTKLIDKIAAIIEKYPWVIPWTRCYKLSYDCSAAFYKDNIFVLPTMVAKKDLEVPCNEEPINGPYMNVMSREAFTAIGGMDERFKGWGGEDVAMVAALTTLVGKPYRMNETIFHLYHDRRDFNQNQELCRRYKSALGDLHAIKALIAERNS